MNAAFQSAVLPRHAQRTAGFVNLAALTIGLALVLPYLAIGIFGGAIVRTAYPIYILTASCLIIRTRRPLYPAFILAVFAFSPFIRRVADYQAGFVVLNFILIAPYVGLLPTLPALFRQPFKMAGGIGGLFAGLLSCILYGSFLAMFRLAFVPAIYEALRWLLPLSLCAFIMQRPVESSDMRRAVLLTLGILLPILTLYGIYQFLYAPAWDVFWMSNIDNATFGEGQPYKIRVFSMMNSPGTVAVFSALAMLLLAGEGALGAIIAAVALPLLALTVIRTAWLALAAGLVVLFLRASPRSRITLAMCVAFIGFTVPVLLASHALPPDIRNLINDRVATFSDLKSDTSTFDRVSVYQGFFDRLSNSPWGEGFGVNESTLTRLGPTSSVAAIDSGILEAYLIYGVVIGTAYFAILALLVAAAWRALANVPLSYSGHFAMICGVIVIMPLGTIQMGETGVLLWTAFGLLLARAANSKSLA